MARGNALHHFSCHQGPKARDQIAWSSFFLLKSKNQASISLYTCRIYLIATLSLWFIIMYLFVLWMQNNSNPGRLTIIL